MLSNEELLTVSGGIIKTKIGIVGGLIVFIIGVIDGIINPRKCN